MVEEIRVKAFAGIAVANDEETGEQELTLVGFETEDGRQVVLRLPRESALNSVTALMAGLVTAAAGTTSYRVAIPTSAWQIEITEAGGAVLHAYLEASGPSRLSFDLKPELLLPLAERFRLSAEHLANRSAAAPMAPSSPARN